MNFYDLEKFSNEIEDQLCMLQGQQNKCETQINQFKYELPAPKYASSISQKLGKDKKYMRQTRSFHSKTKIMLPLQTQRSISQKRQKVMNSQLKYQLVQNDKTIKQKQPINQSLNNLALNYTKFLPETKNLPTQTINQNMDEFFKENDILDSLMSNFGHYADSSIIKEKPQIQVSQPRPSENDIQCSFRPQILRKSLKIASRLGNAQERLTKPKELNKSLEHYSFRPKINKYPNYLQSIKQIEQSHASLFEEDSLDHPKELSQSRKHKSLVSFEKQPRWQQLYDKGKLQMEKFDHLRQQADQDNDDSEELTFKPDISLSQNTYKGQKIIFYTSIIDFQGCTDMSFVDRNNFYAQRKQERINVKVKEIQDESISQCSFRPVVLKNRTQASPNLQNNHSKKGWVEFFDRIKLAEKLKREKLEKEKYISNNQTYLRKYGKNWKNRITRPLEPKLGQKKFIYNTQKVKNSYYITLKENVYSQSNLQIIKQMDPEIQILRKELQLWDF